MVKITNILAKIFVSKATVPLTKSEEKEIFEKAYNAAIRKEITVTQEEYDKLLEDSRLLRNVLSNLNALYQELYRAK